MILKKKKPITPGLRHKVMIDNSLLLLKPRLKNQTLRKKKFAGRNACGHICVGHRGGGHRKIIRTLVNFKENLKGLVVGIEYAPNRTARLARIFDLNNHNYGYILAQHNLLPGSHIQIGFDHKTIRIGNKLPIFQIPAGSVLSSIEQKNGGLLATAAGTSCQLVQKGLISSKLRLPSGRFIFVDSQMLATIGSISNDKNNLQVLGKAGTTRNFGIRPKVRGVAMNPVDHPHGGGGGKPSVTPWGRPTKGKSTSKNKIK